MTFAKDKWYVALCAAIDMFLVKFPDHIFAPCRFGTLTTRHKDCAIISDLIFIKKQTGLSIPDICAWIWEPNLASQIVQVLRHGQEFDQPYSFMPYFMSRNLGAKSPYSTSVNPNLHAWIHMIGCCTSIQRSTNSKLVGQFNLNNTVMGAMVFAFAISTIAIVKPQFSADGTDPTPPDLNDGEEAADAEAHPLPKNLNGIEWFAWFHSYGCQLPNRIKKKFSPVRYCIYRSRG